MVESTDFRDLEHVAELRPLRAPGLRSIAGQGQVAPRPVVVLEIARKDSLQMDLVQHDDVVQALPR